MQNVGVMTLVSNWMEVNFLTREYGEPVMAFAYPLNGLKHEGGQSVHCRPIVPNS